MGFGAGAVVVVGEVVVAGGGPCAPAPPEAPLHPPATRRPAAVSEAARISARVRVAAIAVVWRRPRRGTLAYDAAPSMTERPPDLAERVLGLIDAPAQVTVVRRRALRASSAGQAPQTDADTLVEITCIRDGRTGTATTRGTDPDALHETAARSREAATAREAPAHPGLPEPAAARAHEGFDLATAQLDRSRAEEAVAQAGARCEAEGRSATCAWVAADTETAIAASTGLRAEDRVTDVRLFVLARNGDGRAGRAAGAASAAADVDATAIAERALLRVSDATPGPAPAGVLDVVFDADAVAGLLDHLGAVALNGLRQADGTGLLCGRLGEHVAASAVNLSDSPRFARTLPRAFDADGVPKAPLPLIQDGVAHRVVHDRRSAALAGADGASTGHAIAPGGAPGGPHPTNLVLIGGGAADVAELVGPVAGGLYVTSCETGLLDGVRRITGGALGAPVAPLRLAGGPLQVLATVEALGARQRLVPRGPREGVPFAYGVVCPPLRAGAVAVEPAR